MFKRILVALDITKNGAWQKPLEAAITHARAESTTLHVLTVAPDFGMSFVGSFFTKDQEKKVLQQARIDLRTFVKEHIPSDIKVQIIIGHGTVYEEVIRVSEEINVELIILGSHRPAVKDYLLGPNAARVVRHSSKSVLVIRA